MFKRSSSALKSWVVVSVGALVLALSAFFILSNFSPNSIFAQTPPDTYAQKVRLVPGPVDNDLIYLADPITISYDEKGTGPVTTFTSSDPDTEAARIEWAVTGPDAADFEISAAGVLSFKNPPNFEKPTDRGFDGNLDQTIDASPESPDTTDYLNGPYTLTLDETALGIDLDGDGNTTNNSVSASDVLSEAQLGIDINNDGDLDDTGVDAVAEVDPISLDDEGAGNNVYLIVVRATEVRPGASGLRAASTATQVRVLVNDLDEDGEITLNWRQPQVNRAITATLTDGDVAAGETLTVATWTWYISTVDNPRLRVNDDWVAVTTGTITDVDTTPTNTDATSRIPQTADKDRHLRVMASYPDTQRTGNKTAYGMSDFPVRAVPASNGSPDFGQGAEVEITVPENQKGDVGDAIVATDRNTGDNLTYELLAYTDDNDNDLSTNVQVSTTVNARLARPNDAGFFRIDKATGQLSTPGGLDHEYEFDHDNNANTDGLENYVVIVRVTDPSGDADAVRVTIMASGVDDPPSISKPVSIPYAEHHVNEENSDDVDGTAGIDAPYKDADFTANYHPTGTGHNTYTAADQDDDLINWTIMGPDAGDFKACGGGNSCTVNFKNAPDFDAPADANGDNVYQISLVARSTSLEDSQDVTVVVHNVNEIGSIDFSSDPHIGQALTATVHDPDGARMSASDGSLVPLTDTLSGYPAGRAPDGGVTILSWEWSKPKSMAELGALTPPVTTGAVVANDAHWTPIQDATSAVYTPVGADRGQRLRVKAVYIDPMGPIDNPDTANDERIGPRRLGGIPLGPRILRMATPNAVRVAPGALTIPEFPEATYTRTVAENARVGDYVGEPVVAEDPDNGSLTYTLTGESGQATYFDIDNYGQITVADVSGSPPPLDFEGRPKTFTLSISATDGEGNTSTSPATVTIELTDLNEAPVFDTTSRGVDNALTKSLDYEENGTAPVFNFSATDPEGAAIRWSLMGDDASDFAIDNSGELSFKMPPNFEDPKGAPDALDAELDNTYNVTVRATETAGAQHAGRAKSSEIDLTVTVMDKDEDGSITLSLLQPEGASTDETGTPIMATLTDPDEAAMPSADYQWYRSKVSEPTDNPANDTELNDDWLIATGGGATTVTYTPNAADVGEYLLVRATYNDSTVSTIGADPDDTVYAKSHTVSRESDDADNSSPEFPTSNARIDLTVSESDAVSATVGTVSMATVPARDTLTYDLYAFTTTTTGRNDFSTDAAIYPGNIGPVDAGASTTADTLARPDDDGLFSIDRATGRITLKSKLNHERMLDIISGDDTADDDGQGKYIFFVRAKNSSGLGDDTNDGVPDTAWVKVTVTAEDVNEKPSLMMGSTMLLVREANSSKKTTDDDYYKNLGEEDTVDYMGTPDTDDDITRDADTNTYTAIDPEGANPSLNIEGPDAALFTPKSVTGGGLALLFRDPPNYDAPADADKDNIYHVTVTATDSSNNKGTRAVMVMVMPTKVDDDPADDAAPPTPEETGKLTLTPEQPLLGSMVMASLTDPDGIMTAPDGTDTIASMQWYWTSAEINITAADALGSGVSAVIDDDGMLQADSGYTLSDDVIRDSDGVAVAGKINGATKNVYETKKGDVGRYLHVRVAYRDGSNPEDDPLTTTNEGTDTTPPELGADRVLVKRAAKAVSQTPATTNMPMFPATVARTLAELTPRGGYVGVPVMAEDEDVDDGLDELTYTLNGMDARYFDLLPDPNDASRMTGQIRVKDGTAAGQFDAEGVKSSYTVRLTAMDKTGHEATTNVTIMVGNVNEAPTAPDQSFGLRINGSGTVEHPELLSTMDVGRYRAGGAGGATVSWSLSGADMGQFSPIGADGVLSFKAMPDYENPMDAGTDNSYQVTIMASASGQTDRINVTVNVMNEDEDGVATLWADANTELTVPPQVGDTITGAVMDPDGNPGDTPPIAMDTTITNVDWRWSMSDMMEGTYTPITGATDAAYMVMAADAEMYLKAMATYTDGEGSGKMEEVMTMMVGAEPTEPDMTLLETYDTSDGAGGEPDGSIDKDEYLAALSHYLFGTDDGGTLSKDDYLEILSLYLFGS